VAELDVTVRAEPPRETIGFAQGEPHNPDPLSVMAVGVPAVEYVVYTDVMDGAACAAPAPRIAVTLSASCMFLCGMKKPTLPSVGGWRRYGHCAVYWHAHYSASQCAASLLGPGAINDVNVMFPDTLKYAGTGGNCEDTLALVRHSTANGAVRGV